MPQTEKTYRPLPGRGMAVLQHARVYQGPDHLLQVASTGYSESYKRFYFRDIQAISINKTHWGKIWNGIWSFFTALFGLPAFDMTGTTAIVMGSVAGFFGLFLIGNVALGPTCACFVSTAVQTERLAPVTRIRTARRFLKRVRPLIEASQGSLAREELLLRLRPPGSVEPARADALSVAQATNAEPPAIARPAEDAPPIISTQTPPLA
jgi:hypothetical protein